ncbi:prepilin-type N-terminal cleavage/methylation domain-containing protein [Clostridium swellfunianum]|uniref:prepilin-type N-terminal cleavage/methylation domain-containing protein n=1 Tax=Clostridium swellfunianum TaxID=1367462 RepID=UPI00202F59D1|nr:prepilin-type N-terminal cleavage/methylation domain-containing protein [Clostridium swellfunianum]MCM0650386.1 prepilin-type N-terminal cleavage/methylation domain-containing protein [Clostridium swellfunianum]
MKKGFTIIELIISIGAAGIIAVVMTSMLLTSNSLYVKKTKESRDFFYSMEAILFIENKIKEAKSVNIENNTIELYYEDSSIKKLVKLKDSTKVVIIDFDNNVAHVPNNILTEVSNFQVYHKDNLIYVSISRINGESYEKCISIKTKA